MGTVNGALVRGDYCCCRQCVSTRPSFFPNKELSRTLRLEVVSYFFFRFRRGSLKGPLIPSSTASRAKRSNSAVLFLRGKASGWPTFQSVIWRFGFLVRFFAFAIFSVAHIIPHLQKGRNRLRYQASHPSRRCMKSLDFGDALNSPSARRRWTAASPCPECIGVAWGSALPFFYLPSKKPSGV